MQTGTTDPYAAAIAKGVDFLKREAAKWKNEPDADAARALLVAQAKGFDLGTVLDETLAFLKQPAKWDEVKAPSGSGGKTLATIKFASALAVAERHGRAASTDLEAAAKLLIAEQQPDGSWQVDDSQAAATPATYGTLIATWSARTSLIASGIQPDNFTIVQADKWIRSGTPENVIDAAATILALELSGDVMAENIRRTCLSILRSAQAPSGGWGAEANGAPQLFETVLAVLALGSLEVEPRLARSAYRPEELKEAIAGGKKFIASQQRADGSWPGTTAWALIALLH